MEKCYVFKASWIVDPDLRSQNFQLSQSFTWLSFTAFKYTFCWLRTINFVAFNSKILDIKEDLNELATVSKSSGNTEVATRGGFMIKYVFKNFAKFTKKNVFQRLFFFNFTTFLRRPFLQAASWRTPASGHTEVV